MDKHDNNDSDNNNNNNNNNNDDDEVSIAPLFILCSVDGSIYALDAHSGALKSTSQTGPPLITRSHFKYEEQDVEDKDEENDDDLYDDDDDWEEEIQDDNQKDDQDDDDDDENDNTNSDEGYENDEYDVVAAAADTNDSQSSSRSDEEGTRPGQRRRRRKPRKGRGVRSNDIMEEEEEDAAAAAALMIHPGLDGKLYWQTPIHDEEDEDDDSSSSSLYQLQALPVSMASLLEHPVQSCRSDNHHNHRNPGEPPQPQQCGILTASVAQNTLLALDTQTGALQWSSSSSNGGNHHNNHHSTTGTTTTTTTTTPNPSNGRNNNNNNKNHKRRHNNNHQKNKKKKTVLLQRKDLVVQHISAATGRPLWNVTLGSYQAIDFSSSTTSSSTTTTKNRPPLPLLRFAQGGRQLVALRSSSSSDTAATTPPLQDNDDSNIDNNNNNNKSELASLRNDDHDDAESSASSPTTTTSTPNEDDALTPDEALQVLWRIESPHVLASVFAIDEHGWKAVQVLDDEEEDDINDVDHPVVEYQQKDGPLPRIPASPVDEGAFVQTWSSWHPPSDPQQSQPSQQTSHSWYALPGSATSQPQLVPFFSQQHTQQQEQGQCVSDGETPTTIATTTTTATITSVDDKAVVPPPQSPPQEAADIVEQIPSLPPPQENATVPSPAPPSLVLEPPGPNPLPMGPRPPYYAYPPQSMLMMTHAHNQLEHEKLMDDLMQAIRWGIVVLAVVILVSWMLWMQYHQRRRRRCHNNSQGRHKKPAWTRRSNSTTEPRSSTSNINGNSPESSTSRPSLMESSSSALSSSLPLSFLAGMGHNGNFPPKPYLAKNRATLPLVRSSLSFPGVIPSSFHVTSTTATAPNNNHNKNMGLMGAPRRTTTDDEPKPPNAKDNVSGEIALAQENDDGDKNKNNNAQVTTATAPGVATEPDNPSPLQTAAAAVAAVIQHPTGVGTTTVPLVQYARYDSEFEELEALGRGGFGSVVRCRNKLDGRDYAIKKVTIQGGGRGGNHDNNPQAQVQQFQQELARVLREVKILAVLDHPNIVRYFTAWLEMDPDAKTKPKLKSNRRTSTSNNSSGGNKSNSSSDATPPQTTNNSSAKSLYPQRRSAKSSNKIHSSLSAAASSSSSLLWSQRLRNKWHGRNQDRSSAAWSEQNRAANAIAASLQVNACGIDDDCGIIFEDSSAMGESGGGGGGKNVLKCQTLGYHHDRSEQISESGGASSAWDDDEENDQDRDDARMDKDRDLVDGAVPIVQHTLYIQMQLCRCDTLADFLVDKESRRGRSSRRAKGGNKNKNNKNNSKNNSNAVDIPLALSLLLQVAKAVQHVHEKGLIHRDLKPSNCFIDDDGVVKVGDFGLSRETSSARVNGNKNIDDGTAPLDDDDDGTDKETADAAIVAQLFGDDVADDNADHHVDHTAGVGTRLYASPEQTEGSSYDSSTDVYSLGIILYELCYPMYTGMERNICLSKLRQQRQFPLDWHTVVGPYYGEPIQTLLKSMLDPRPSLRPTALEVAQRIKGVMGELTILSPPRTRPPRRSKSNASDHAWDNGSGSNDNEDDDDDNLLFLRVESNCQDNALQHTLSLIQSAEQEGKIKVDILQSGMAKQAHTDTTILEFAVQFRLENDDHQNNDNQVGETTSTTSSSSGWDNPQQYLVDRLEQSKEIIRVQQISVHHCHHHHHHHHHHSSASPRASD
ncbi:hypothetical protein ACA910_000142 [Epithemia clementina (nom. ined.)]